MHNYGFGQAFKRHELYIGVTFKYPKMQILIANKRIRTDSLHRNRNIVCYYEAKIEPFQILMGRDDIVEYVSPLPRMKQKSGRCSRDSQQSTLIGKVR